MCTTKPQLRSSSPPSEPPGVPSPAGLSTGGISASGAQAGAAAAIPGWSHPAEDDAAAHSDAAGVVTRLAQPQRLSTATLSRSSADKVLAFLTNLCFLRLSFRARRRASAASFWAFCIAARAAAMLSSKSMRGFLARLAVPPLGGPSWDFEPSAATTCSLRSASAAAAGALVIAMQRVGKVGCLAGCRVANTTSTEHG